MTDLTARPKILQRFTAVDLVTLAVFAAIYRAMWYVWQAIAFLWPFNLILNTLLFCLIAVAGATVVRKFGALFMFNVAAQAINFFVQGASVIEVVACLTWALAAEAYIYARLRSGADPFSNFRDMFIAGTLLSLLWIVSMWYVLFPFVFLVELSLVLTIAASVAGFIGGMAGGAIGFGLGDRIKGLIG
jgi:hypothetical protein